MNNIKKIRQSKNLTQSILSNLTGIDQSIIAKLERGLLKLNNKYIEKLTIAFDCKEEDLIKNKNNEILDIKLFSYPYNLQEETSNSIKVHGSIQNHINNDLSNLIAIKNKGESMSPRIADGDVLLIDPNVTDIHSDGIYAFFYEKSLFIKTVQRIHDNNLKIISDNKNFHDFIIDTTNSNLEIIGMVKYNMLSKI